MRFKKLFALILSISLIMLSGCVIEGEAPTSTNDTTTKIVAQKESTATTQGETNTTEESTTLSDSTSTTKETTSEAKKSNDAKSTTANNSTTESTNKETATNSSTTKLTTQKVQNTNTTTQTTVTHTQSSTTTKKPTEYKYCTLTIECTKILSNIEKLKDGHEAYVPKSGYILNSYKVNYENNMSAYDALKAGCKANGIKISSRSTTYGTYVSGINNLDEKDCGENSGWLYYINGSLPQFSCDKYQLKPFDDIKFSYTC